MLETLPGQKRVALELPPKFEQIFEPFRYKVYYGGRGSSKSHSVARYLLARAIAKPTRILCAREFQNSIQDSVHKLLADLIRDEGLTPFFDVQRASIQSVCGSQFLFVGLHHNIQSVKSTEGVDICWVEEAEHVAESSWDILIPTIRKPGSEILITFNPNLNTDPTYQRFVAGVPPPGTLRELVNWRDNPWFPDVLADEMAHCRAHDYEKYLHIWEGRTRTYSDAQIFRGKYVVEDFESPRADEEVTLRFGADWGFAKDPVALVRCFTRDGNLYIEYEAFAYHLDLRQVGPLFRTMPGLERQGIASWKIWGDGSRPETIGFLAHPDGGGFNIAAADKWPGSVEDGIEFIRSFKKVVIHPRCKNAIYEFGAYSYKVDRLTNEILPIVVDEHNHIIDSIRYALTPLITRKSTIYDAGIM